MKLSSLIWETYFSGPEWIGKEPRSVLAVYDIFDGIVTLNSNKESQEDLNLPGFLC